MRTITLVLTGLFLLGEGGSSLQGSPTRFSEGTYISSEFHSPRGIRQRRRRRIQRIRKRVKAAQRQAAQRLAAQRLAARRKAAQKKLEKQKNIEHRGLARTKAETLLRASLNSWQLRRSRGRWYKAYPNVEVVDHRSGEDVFGLPPGRLLDIKTYPRIKLEKYEIVSSRERTRLKNGKFRGVFYKVQLHIKDKFGKSYMRTHTYTVSRREGVWKIFGRVPIKKPTKIKIKKPTKIKTKKPTKIKTPKKAG